MTDTETSILLIAPSKRDCAQLRGLLGETAEPVLEAIGVEEGVAVLDEHLPDCVVLDARLLEDGGLDLLSALRRAGDDAQTPVVLIGDAEDDSSLSTQLGVMERLSRETLSSDLLALAISKVIALANHDRENKRKRMEFEGLDRECARARKETSDRTAELIRVNIALEEAKQREQHLTTHDALTNLPNRQLFQELLANAVEYGKRHQNSLAVLVVDLDHFKPINDTFGHSSGDALLRLVASRLEGAIRRSDTVARLGGDEFIVLLPRIVRPQDAAVVAREIISSLGSPYSIGNLDLNVTPSVGIATFPEDADSPESLIGCADLAMYGAKRCGRNAYRFFSRGMNMVTTEDLQLDRELRRAINRDEFLIHLQPQIECPSGRLVGAEALVRWQHPERGLVPPGQFIPIAETSGLIAQIGEMVLRKACLQLRIWQERGFGGFPISVNLSNRQLRRNDLVETVRRILNETGLQGSDLILEITESCIMEDLDTAMGILKGLKTLGTKISIDDFGTGYSSLAVLERFPIDTLKVDRSFVLDITTNRAHASIVRAILQLSEGLGLSVVAEGVEQEAEKDLLLEYGCRVMQGFLFGRPIPVDEFEEVWGPAQRVEAPPTRAQ